MTTATHAGRIGWQGISAFVGATMGHGDGLFRRGGREKALIAVQAVTLGPETAALLICVFLESAEVRAEKLLIESGEQNPPSSGCHISGMSRAYET